MHRVFCGPNGKGGRLRARTPETIVHRVAVQACSTAPAHTQTSCLMGRCPEPDPDGPFGPGNGVGLQQFLNAVLP
jgi:hypothetical protein